MMVDGRDNTDSTSDHCTELKVLDSKFLMDYARENTQYMQKLKDTLVPKYRYLRQMKKDGSCFYRAVLLALIELIHKQPTKLDEHLTLAKRFYDRLLNVDGLSETSASDFYEMVQAVRVKEGQQSITFSILNFLRLQQKTQRVVGREKCLLLVDNKEEYEKFLPETTSLSDFCKKEVEPITSYSEDIHVFGLLKLFGLSATVHSISPNTSMCISYPEDGRERRDLHVLHDALHYDMLYDDE